MKKLSTTYFLLFTLIIGNDLNAQGNQIQIGSLAPEIALPTPKGDKVMLSSMRGNLVLVDFWATWCAPCVEEQPELKRLYSKYNHANDAGKNLEILGVSLDNKKEAWEKTIKKFNIKWTQVSDLKFWTSPVAKTYDIQALPYNLLVDEKGYIVALNLHGKELESFIDKYLQPK